MRVQHPQDASRPTLIAETKQIEAAIAAMLGDSMVEIRRGLEEQLAAKKKALMDLKPLGKRLDDTRAALDRSRKRLAVAEDSVVAAQMSYDQAKEEETKLSTELIALEASIGTDSPLDSDSITSLSESLASAVEAIRNISCLPKGVAEDAQAQADLILKRFQSTMASAERAMEIAKLSLPKRLMMKQPPPPPPIVDAMETAFTLVSRRHTSKKPAQDAAPTFGPIKKRSRANSDPFAASPYG